MCVLFPVGGIAEQAYKEKVELPDNGDNYTICSQGVAVSYRVKWMRERCIHTEGLMKGIYV